MHHLRDGTCAEVFYDKENIFKTYFKDTLNMYRIQIEMFNWLKTLREECFIKLYEVYKNSSRFEILKDKKETFIVDAYTAKYYKEEKINILYKSIDYLLDNFKKLEDLFAIFSNNGVLTDDVFRKNVVLTSNGIIIIDPDLFSIYKKEDLVIKNKNNLLNLLNGLCMYKSCIKSDLGVMKFANKVTDFEVLENTEIAYELSRKLKGCKRPIDYLSK